MMSLLSVPISVKEVYTCNSREFHVNPNWTISQFIQTIIPLISSAFNISTDILELVESGQYNGSRPELHTALAGSDVRMKDKWGPKLDVAFYVRRKNIVYVEPAIITNNPLHCVYEDCPVCLENRRVFQRYGCVHRICDGCFQNCLSSDYIICPVCRHS